jgi:hypothetical protein
MSDGSYGAPTNDGNPLGIVYSLNFSIPFSTAQSFNMSTIFGTTSKGAGGSEANNIGPLYYDGAMFANDYEWITYGGLLSSTDAYSPPPDDEVAQYNQYAYGPPEQFENGFVLEYLPSGLTRYITDGAAVSVPSENLGFYFGGLRSATFGDIYYDPGAANASLNADSLSETLIKVDMSDQENSVWHNYTLPTSVPGRANAEIVWIPVSKQGILVAIGGVIFPSYANVNQTDNPAQTLESEQQSPAFMSTVAVYDVANQVWYEQETSGPPGQLTQGCAVVASAQDGSSHNIYWYGGFDGLHPAATFSDDVWVLSVPSFMWMKVKSGTPSHGRAGHKCVKPYPDQMFVIGGYPSLGGADFSCLEGNIIQVFNLSSLDWLDNYDPSVWSNYSVPSMIYDMIGGTGTGSATQTAPSSTTSSNATMIALFQQQYNTSKITTWYPYQAATTSSTPRPTLPSVVPKPGSGTPSFLAPVLAVILGLVFITVLVVGIMLWRRRRLLSVMGTATQSENGTVDPRRGVLGWLRAVPADAKAPTITTEETPSSPYDDENPYMPPEIGGGQVHEMMDTSRPQELSDSGTGLVPLALLSRNSAQGGLTSSPSVASHTSATSTISNISGRHPSNPAISPIAPSPNSPEEGRIISGVSNLSETDKGHLRGISETSGVSVATGSGAAAISPLSPPKVEGGDYISAKAGGEGTSGPNDGSGSPGSKRRSNFSEELGESKK